MAQRIEPIEVHRPAFAFEGRYLHEYGGSGGGKSWAIAEKHIKRCLLNGRERFLVLRKVDRTIRESVYELLKEVSDHYELGSQIRFYDGRCDVYFANGAQMITSGLDNREKLKSIARVTSVWVEEATEFDQEDLAQIDLRLRGEPVTYQQITYSYNPIDERHPLKKQFHDKHPEGFDPATAEDVLLIHSTWMDNPHAGDSYAKAFERLDDRLKAIYEKGEWGQLLEGLIYPEWSTFSHTLTDPDFYGLDFGYAKPTSLSAHAITEDDLYSQEVIYQTHLTNQDLIELMKAKRVDRRTPIYADSAEPDRIKEIKRAGFNIYPAQKDVNDGIDAVKRYRLHVHKDSVNIQNEYRTYLWMKDSGGQPIDKPVKHNDHAMDSKRYGVYTYTKPVKKRPRVGGVIVGART